MSAAEWEYVAGARERLPRRQGAFVRPAAVYEWVQDCTGAPTPPPDGAAHEGNDCQHRLLYRLVEGATALRLGYLQGIDEPDFTFRVARAYPASD